MRKKVTVKRQCSICGETKKIKLTAKEHEKYLVYLREGGLIQEVLPKVAPADRELLRGMDGVCGKGWKMYFGQR